MKDSVRISRLKYIVVPIVFSLAFFILASIGKSEESNPANQVIATIMQRKSIRDYLSRPVPGNLLEIIAECGIHAPSAMNRQPWAIRIINSSDYINQATHIYRSNNKNRPLKSTDRNIFRNAPAVIFVGGPDNGEGLVDCGMLGENMLIAAQSLGLGTCVLGGIVPFFNSPEMKTLLAKLDLPPGYKLLYAIAIGYPAENPEPRERDKSKIKFIE